MFGRKKEKKQPKEKFSELQINTMPSIFYGGNDPEIYHSKEEAAGGPSSSPTILIKNNQKAAAKQVQTQAASADSGKKKKIILWTAATLLFLAGLGGIIWYYTKDFNTPTQPNKTPQKINDGSATSPTVTPTTTEKLEIPTSTSSQVEPTSTPELPSSLGTLELQFPSIMLSDTEDIDNDQLTDKEEELFETDSGGFDSDKDGYFDGQEVFNLYNPKGIAPRKIIDSGLVKEYTNPLTNYRLYYPLTWQAGEVDTLGRQVLFSNIEGDYIEVRTLDKSNTETFAEWFAGVAKGQKITDLIVFKNRFKVEGWRRRDDLIVYFVDQNKIYAVVYHPAEIGPVSYRHIMKMLAQSFRYASTIQSLEEQPLITTNATSTASAPTSTAPVFGSATPTLPSIVETSSSSPESVVSTST